MPRGKQQVVTIEDRISAMKAELERLSKLKNNSDVAVKMVEEFTEKLEKETGYTLKSTSIAEKK